MLAVGMVILLLLGFCAAPRLARAVGGLDQAPSESIFAEACVPQIPSLGTGFPKLEEALNSPAAVLTGSGPPD